MSYVRIDLEAMFEHREPWDCANSVANLGPSAAQLTWGCALEIASNPAWLKEGDAVAWARNDAAQTGAWDDVDDWSEAECLAYLVQCVAHDLRLLGSDDCDLSECLTRYEETDWDQECEYPQCALYRGKDGRICAELYFS